MTTPMPTITMSCSVAIIDCTVVYAKVKHSAFLNSVTSSNPSETKFENKVAMFTTLKQCPTWK